MSTVMKKVEDSGCRHEVSLHWQHFRFGYTDEYSEYSDE
jgi:hypothetical protein